MGGTQDGREALRAHHSNSHSGHEEMLAEHDADWTRSSTSTRIDSTAPGAATEFSISALIKDCDPSLLSPEPTLDLLAVPEPKKDCFNLS
tara:strand:- start:348 stop:617 length:270 start_codon:yes stop_codon:yes gene_type:complete